MFKTSLALILIAMQGLSSLPGQLHLCFEADGSICCVEGGEHRCDCNHECGHDEVACHDCDHTASTEPEPCGYDAEASTGCGDDRSHQHVVIAALDQQSVITKTTAFDVDEFSNSFGLASPICPSEPLLSVLPSVTPIPAESSAVTFSLIARASTVLRC